MDKYDSLIGLLIGVSIGIVLASLLISPITLTRAVILCILCGIVLLITVTFIVFSLPVFTNGNFDAGDWIILGILLVFAAFGFWGTGRQLNIAKSFYEEPSTMVGYLYPLAEAGGYGTTYYLYLRGSPSGDLIPGARWSVDRDTYAQWANRTGGIKVEITYKGERFISLRVLEKG